MKSLPGLGAARHRVLVYDPDRLQGEALVRELHPVAENTSFFVVDQRDGYRAVRSQPLDLGLVNLASSQLDGLAVGAELAMIFPEMEVVFWYDELHGAPAAAAARAVGVTRVLPVGSMTAWLAEALVQLAKMTRARRVLLRAQSALPPLPAGAEADQTLPLPEAERRFREAYLRRMLAASGNQVMAARSAGIPYTTFSSMLKKLGLRGTLERSAPSPSRRHKTASGPAS